MSDRTESDIVSRRLINDDIICVSKLITSCYRNLAIIEGYDKVETEWLVQTRGSIEAITQQSQQYTFWVAMQDNIIVGVMAYCENELAKLYINPKYKRQGFGKALFKLAEDKISMEGYSKISLGAFPSSVKFYEKMGAKTIAEKLVTTGPIKGHKIILMDKNLSQ